MSIIFTKISREAFGSHIRPHLSTARRGFACKIPHFNCIHGDDDSPQMYINPDVCIGCAACEPECPVEAIFEDSTLPDEWKHFEQINADYYKDK